MGEKIRTELEELILKALKRADYEAAYKFMELRLTVARIDDLEKNK